MCIPIPFKNGKWNFPNKNVMLLMKCFFSWLSKTTLFWWLAGSEIALIVHISKWGVTALSVTKYSKECQSLKCDKRFAIKTYRPLSKFFSVNEILWPYLNLFKVPNDFYAIQIQILKINLFQSKKSTKWIWMRIKRQSAVSGLKTPSFLNVLFFILSCVKKLKSESVFYYVS